MNPKFALLAALVAGLLPAAATAQTAPAATQPAAPTAATPAQPAAAAQPAAPDASAAPAGAGIPAPPTPNPPSAYPAKIALVAFQQAVYETNEGKRAVEDVRKKYLPQKDKIDALAAEIDSLKKKLQAAPATLTDTERKAQLKAIDDKDKEYQRQADDAQTAFNSDLQEALGKVAQKVNAVMLSYVEKNGYTILLNVGDQQSPVMWTATTPNADITDAIIEAYNTASGVAAPPPPAPSAMKPAATTPKPATTKPSTTTPHPATKPPTQ
jgi:outer membrane protein